MNRFCLNIALGFVVVLLSGCSKSEEEPFWKGIKIGDLAPTTGKGESRTQLLKTINFKVYTLELPAENIGDLNDVWPMLYTGPVRFNDSYAFKANSFSIGVGQMKMWNKVVKQLDGAGAKVATTVTLLLASGEPDNLAVATLAEKKDVSYVSGIDSLKAATIGPGTAGLRIRAEKIPGSRGVCEVYAQPVFSPAISQGIRLPGEQEKRNDFFFTVVGFRLKMSPGDFFLLGPRQHPKDQTTLGGVFFNGAGRKATVKAYLLFCTNIVD